ncbi:hypothetical protein LP419_35665 [Massilia sp. H-1]|nr:hypothetical protein LP419_35665 [Massilia sp. H-1]
MRQLDVDAGDYAHWSGDSGALYFSLGDQLFRRDVKQAFAAPDPDEKKEKDRLAAIVRQPGVRIGFAAKTARPSGTSVIDGARIVTMRGDEVIDNGRIVIKDNRIAAVGRARDVALLTCCYADRRQGQDGHSGHGRRALARRHGRRRHRAAAKLGRLRLAWPSA